MLELLGIAGSGDVAYGTKGNEQEGSGAGYAKGPGKYGLKKLLGVSGNATEGGVDAVTTVAEVGNRIAAIRDACLTVVDVVTALTAGLESVIAVDFNGEAENSDFLTTVGALGKTYGSEQRER